MSFDAGKVVLALKGASSGAIGFAFGLKKDGNILFADKQKSGEQLLTLLKKEGGISQSCFGEVSGQGSELTFICPKPLHDLGKQLENWGKANKWNFRAVVTSEGKASAKDAGKADDKADSETDEEEEEEDDSGIYGGETIKRRLVQAKTKSMNFAFGIGSGKAGDLLSLHPRRDPEKLLLALRAENGAAKRASGTVSVGAGKATFKCLDAPFAAMKRAIRALFKEWKLPLGVIILGPEGEEFDDPEDHDEQNAAPESPEIARLRAQLDNARPRLDAVVEQDPARKADLDRDLARFEAAAGSGDAGAAREALVALAQLVKAPPASAAPPREKDPALVKLRLQFENAQPRLLKTFTDASRMAVYEREVAAFEAAEAEGSVDQARAALDRLAAAAKESSGPPRGSLVMLQKSRLEWDGLRKSIQRQLGDLEKSITSAVDAHNQDEEAPDSFDENALAKSFGVLRNILGKLDERLIDKLDQALNAEGEARRGFHQEAAVLVAEYKDYVDTDPVIAAIDDNGFLSLNIRAQAQAALSALAKQL